MPVLSEKARSFPSGDQAIFVIFLAGLSIEPDPDRAGNDQDIPIGFEGKVLNGATPKAD